MNTKETAKPGTPAQEMRVIRPKVAGVDIGSTEHYVCVPAGKGGETQVRRFGTTSCRLRS